MDVLQNNSFKSSSYNVKDKTSILTIFSRKNLEKLRWKDFKWIKNILPDR